MSDPRPRMIDPARERPILMYLHFRPGLKHGGSLRHQGTLASVTKHGAWLAVFGDGAVTEASLVRALTPYSTLAGEWRSA
jgi:hypothetical protein